MQTVTSKDGTRIAYDQYGSGPTLILVGGALQHRAFDAESAKLATLLAPHFTVFHYDRRGRGDSGDTPPYAVDREIEDLEALIDAGGGSVFLFGLSSGAALSMETSIRVPEKVRKMVMYEVPYDDDPVVQQKWVEFGIELKALLAANRCGEAVSLFLTLLGTTADDLQQFSHSPVWSLFESVAPTIAYDVAILGDRATVPVERASQVTVPTLLMHGGAESHYLQGMHTTMMTLSGVIPHARTHILEGQNHFVSSDALAPVLVEYFHD